jgi:hypothetical protein
MAYYVECNRTGGSIFGAASALLKENGTVKPFDTREEAEQRAAELNAKTRSANLFYRVLD